MANGHDTDFNEAQAIIRAAYPEYELDKNGELVNGIYLFWGQKQRLIDRTVLLTSVLTALYDELKIRPNIRLDESAKEIVTELKESIENPKYEYVRNSFEVEKASGEIVNRFKTDWRWKKDCKRVAALSEADIEQIENQVISTGLCMRDQNGRVVTNSGDCFLTLVDGNSVWVSLAPCEDYEAKYPHRRAIRPTVEAYPYTFVNKQGERQKHHWTIRTNWEWEAWWMRGHNQKKNPLDRNLTPDEQLPKKALCIVGNVVEQHVYGVDKVVLKGSKHFRPGAKLYILDGFWGMGGEHLIVMGQPRKHHDLIKIVIRRSLICNFRVKQVYDKRVIRELYGPFGDEELRSESLNEELEKLANYWNSNELL